jgi:dihydroneopterin aldolase/2-amino-4-hydroxy-6-hydroxymethyldihydropteridine diphosphokinase
MLLTIRQYQQTDMQDYWQDKMSEQSQLSAFGAMVHTAYIGIGSNLGDRRAMIEAAVNRLRADDAVDEVELSSVLETDPVGGPEGQERFFNAAARVRTTRAVDTLMELLHQIETELGRTRRERWGPRVIDLDLLLFDDAVIEEPELTVPHPRMCEREFVLEPLAEIAGNVMHPVRKQSISHLLGLLRAG